MGLPDRGTWDQGSGRGVFAGVVLGPGVWWACGHVGIGYTPEWRSGGAARGCSGPGMSACSHDARQTRFS